MIKENSIERKREIVYSEQQLIALDAHLTSLGIIRFGERELQATDHYLITLGAMRVETVPHFNPIVVDPVLYTEMNNKISQWGKWKSRNQFIEVKKSESYQRLADSMKLVK